MTANPSNLGAVLYADEASFAEASTTFDERLPVVNSITEMIAGLEQSSEDFAQTVQYQNDGYHDARLIQGGSFTIEMMLTGLGEATTGAINSTQLTTFLGRVIGNELTSNVGTTVTGTPTDADTFTLTGGTWSDGSLARIGSLGDGRGNGQFVRFDDAATPSDPIVLTALDATPNASDVVYAPALIYPSEGPTAASITTFRFQLQSANQRYNCYGCYPTAIEFTGLAGGELPRVRVTIAVSAWEPENASTFPTATAVDTDQPAPVAAGSVFIQDVGTTTRNTVNARDLTISIDLQNVPLTGTEATRAFQSVVGVRRVKCQASLSFTLDREAAGTDTWGDYWNTKSPAYKHAMVTLSAVDQCAVGFYFPRLKRMGARPTQMDRNGLNAHTVNFMATSGGTTTTALEHANFVLGIG